MLTGTLINTGTVLAGTTVGVTVGRRLPDRVQARVLAGIGLVTVVIGVDDALAWRGTSPLIVLGAVLLGGLAGELMRIEDRLEGIGGRLQRRLAGRGRGHERLSEAWVTASLLFCVGPLTVLGSIQDGLTGDYSTLATKAMLDGFAALALSSSLGWGVGLAGLTVLVVQGVLSLGAGLFRDVLTGEALAAVTSAGGVLILGIALKLLDLRDVRVGNFLPALVIAPALVGLVRLVR